jgi:NTP pyrophosphatase (non-canonical NTP hydrolase)
MKTLNELSKDIHQNAVDKGFWDNNREVGTLLMLIVSEISEAMEADRNGRYADLSTHDDRVRSNHGLTKDVPDYFNHSFETLIKDTFEDELADTIIRILDLCGAMNIDIQRHIDLKIEYNKSRDKMHGGKKY